MASCRAAANSKDKAATVTADRVAKLLAWVREQITVEVRRTARGEVTPLRVGKLYLLVH